MASQKIAFSPSLIPLVGDATAALVLCQIMYWHQGRLRVPRHGRLWLAKSRLEMCAETGITLEQYKRIMPLLVQRGLILMERGLFNNKVTPHIRLTELGFATMKEHLLGDDIKHLAEVYYKQSFVNGSNPLFALNSNLITEITTENTTESDKSKVKKYAEKTGVDPEEKDQDQEIRQEQEHKGKTIKNSEDPKKNNIAPNLHFLSANGQQEHAMKAHEILQAKEPSPHGSLVAYWKSRCHTVSGEYQHHLTGQEGGQLKHLSKFLGEQTRPVIDYAVTNWWKFASLAALKAGLKTWPTAPHIGYLLKHYHVAVNLLIPLATASPIGAEEAAPVQPIALAGVTSKKRGHLRSPEELAALLEKDLKSP